VKNDEYEPIILIVGLRQMNEKKEMILRPSRKKWLGILLMSLLFCAIGVMMIRDGKMLGWFPLLAFGIVAIVSLVLMFPGVGYLKLDKDGFTVCSLYRASTFRWDDVTEFGLGFNKLVSFNFSPAYTQHQRMREINKAIGSFDAAIPDSYGMTPEDLLLLMNKWMASNKV
jgi:hypothetical protein